MKSSKCLACGFVGWSDLGYCKACGATFGQPGAYYPQGNPAYTSWDQPEGQKKGLAIGALVVGILSFLTFGFFGAGAITGIVLAVVAMKRVKNEPWEYGGRGIAIAGLVLSISSILVVVPVGMVAAIAIPNLLASRMAANEGAAFNSLRTISAAEMVYQQQFERYGTLEELAEAKLIDRALGSGTKSGYRFTIELTDGNTGFERRPDGFTVNCVPLDYRHSGMRSFYVDQTQVIRGGDRVGGPSSADDPPLEMRSMRADRERF